MSKHTVNDLRLYSETTISHLVTANWEMDTEIKKLKERIAELENLLVECRGFDCCPLASKLNAADDRIAELKAANKRMREWRDKAFEAHPNLDLDIELLGGGENG